MELRIRRDPDNQWQKKEYKCMNCGKVIKDPNATFDSKRFCDNECKQRYLGKN